MLMQKGRGNRIRIIGGEHRGRKLRFPDTKGLRPTADRVRETLFNWLQPVVQGASCLDLFAGSGALGLEALSRGAAYVLFAEQSRTVASRLQENVQLLNLQARAEVRQLAAGRLLSLAPQRSFDLVFLDPPFADRMLPQVCRQLEEGDWMADGALIYLEQDSASPWPELPQNWQLQREGKAGQAAFRLMKRATIKAV